MKSVAYPKGWGVRAFSLSNKTLTSHRYLKSLISSVIKIGGG